MNVKLTAWQMIRFSDEHDGATRCVGVTSPCPESVESSSAMGAECARDRRRERGRPIRGLAAFAAAMAAALASTLAVPTSAQQAPGQAPGANPGATGPAAATTGPGAAAAAKSEPAYNIELIVFRATSALGGAENWSVEQGGSDVVGGEESSGGSVQVGRFVGMLASSQYQLTEIENRLRSSGAYVPIAHVAWSQTASAWGTRAGFPINRLGVEAAGLTGNVFLERGQYLHLGMTLSYADPNPPGGLGAAPGTTFTINQSRRVKFYDRNYYDHPAFGVIALVTPAQGARAPGR